MSSNSNKFHTLSNITLPSGSRRMSINSSYTLTHELSKMIAMYLLKAGYDLPTVELVLSCIKCRVDAVSKSVDDVLDSNRIKPDTKAPEVFCEAKIGKYQTDLVYGNQKCVVEIDHKHDTPQEKVDYLSERGFSVWVIKV